MSRHQKLPALLSPLLALMFSLYSTQPRPFISLVRCPSSLADICHLNLVVDDEDDDDDYDITNYSGSEPIAKKNCGKCHIRWLWVEFLENGSSKDYEILQTYR